MGSQLDNHWPKFYSAFMCACGGPSSYLGDALSNSWYQPAVRNLYWLEARRGFLITLTLPFSIWLLFLLGPFSLYDPVLKSEINRLGINIPITVRRHWNVNIWKIDLKLTTLSFTDVFFYATKKYNAIQVSLSLRDINLESSRPELELQFKSSHWFFSIVFCNFQNIGSQ